MPRPRTYDYADVRERAIDEAGRILAAEGAAAVSMRRVAEAADTSTNLLYRLFRGKAGLVEAMFVVGFERLERRLDAVPHQDDVGAEIIALGHAYRAAALASPHLYGLMFSRPVPEFVPDAALIDRSRCSFERLVETVARGIAAGVVDGAHPAERAAAVLHALVHGLASMELQGWLGGPAERDAHWEAALEGGLLRRTPPV